MPGTRPPQDQNVTIGRRQRDVGVCATTINILVAQHTNEDCRVKVGRVDHADVAGRVVEVLQLFGKGPQEGGEVVVVEEGLVARGVGEFC